MMVRGLKHVLIGSKNYEPDEHRRVQHLEQLILLRERRINGCLHEVYSTLKFGHVKACAKARGEEFMRDV